MTHLQVSSSSQSLALLRGWEGLMVVGPRGLSPLLRQAALLRMQS